MRHDATTPVTQYLDRPGGRVGYDVIGEGPLVVLVPGMGDLRSSYRFLAPLLAEAGYRVACSELRGHGDSDATFATYGDADTAGDVLALTEELGGRAVLVGNSMGAGAAVIAAAQRPDLVCGLVLVGPFVRDPDIGATRRLLLRAVMARPWRPSRGSRTCPNCTEDGALRTSRSTATGSSRACLGQVTQERCLLRLARATHWPRRASTMFRCLPLS